MKKFLRENKFVYIALLFLIIAIPIGFIINNGGIIIISLILLLITLKDLFFKILRHRRLRHWLRLNNDKVLINIYSESLDPLIKKQIFKLSGEYIFSVFNGDRIETKLDPETLKNLYRNEGLYMDEQFVLHIKNEEVLRIELKNELNQLLNKLISVEEFLRILKNNCS